MKSKEYAEMYTMAPLSEKSKTLAEIARLFICEIATIAKQRKSKFDRALIPICNDLNKKWIKFAEIINTTTIMDYPLSYSGFKELVKQFLPELFILWNPK